MRIDILTLFPETFQPVIGHSMLRLAQEKGLVSYHLWNIRDYSLDKHKKVDDRPYGGGPGMVMMPEPVFRAIEEVEKDGSEPARKVLLTPQGERFTQSVAGALSRESRLMLVCGHYEGFDERIRQGFDFLEISIGDYVLSGGEVPAMVVIDAVVRLVPGVLGDEDSSVVESFKDSLLEYPQYTRPREFRGLKVPDVLVSGHHEEIQRWREEQARERTRTKRPDLLVKAQGQKPT
ncbi:MAG: tRNA (guanosine(37)-N1)-methyltransferase TrmD, partial [Candidatus Brocadiales bacterium]